MQESMQCSCAIDGTLVVNTGSKFRGGGVKLSPSTACFCQKGYNDVNLFFPNIGFYLRSLMKKKGYNDHYLFFPIFLTVKVVVEQIEATTTVTYFFLIFSYLGSLSNTKALFTRIFIKNVFTYV